MSESMDLIFRLSAKQNQKIEKWKAKQGTRTGGAIGGRFTYEFTPTASGTTIKVKEGSKEIDVTDVESDPKGYTFIVSAEELAKASAWKDAEGIKGDLTYQFTPTSLGTIVTVKDYATGKKINVTDFSGW